MIGLFINRLPGRLAVPGSTRLAAWLSALQRAQAVAGEYEYAPLVRIQGWSDVPRGTPLFDSHFIYENYPVERSGEDAIAGRLRVTDARGTAWTTYPLSLMVYPGHGELRCVLSYDERRFDAGTPARMLRQLERVLEQVAAGVDARLSDLELLDAAEREQVVVKWNERRWNQTATAYPADRRLDELFDEQAATTPTAVAIVCGEETI